MVVRGHLGLSDHEMIEVLVLAKVQRRASKTTTMEFQRVDFGLFRIMGQRAP